MPCCKAETYNWCVDFPTIGRVDGKEYCVFHAPKGTKGISVEKFNDSVFTRINTAKQFDRPCNLSGTIFEGDISFSQFGEDNPLPHIDFSNTTFSGNVIFSRTAFSGEAHFSMATFSEQTYFLSSRFRKKAYFVNATFNGIAYFSRTIFSRQVNFVLATFSGETIFIAVEFVSCNFRNIKIKEKVKFELVNLKKVAFIDTDLRRIDFIRCTWHEKYGRYVLYDEVRLFEEIGDDEETGNLLYRLKQRFKGSLSEILKREWTGFKKDTFFDKREIEKVEILYRRLKQKYKEERDEPMVSIWHYGEKEIFRKKSGLRRFNPISLSNLYWLSSGYAEKDWRAGIVLLLLIFAISFFLALSGLEPLKGDSIYGIEEIKGLTNIMDFHTLWVLILNTLQYATFQKEPYLEPLTLLGGYLKLLARILIPLQTALFALAVRNKLRR